MPLETATYITSLVVTNPDGSDQKATADDHIRLIKACLRRSFPQIDGAVSLSHTQLMRLNDVSASVQLQINTLRDGSATVYNALYANSASFAVNANNSLSLGGHAAATYPRLSLGNEFTSYNAFAGIRITNTNSTPSGGHGLEIDYNGVRGRILSYNRGASSYVALALEGSNISLAYTGTLQANGATIWHSGNDGAGSGLDADMLDGRQGSEAASGSTAALRTATADLHARYFNFSAPVAENPGVSSVCVTAGDGYIRNATPAYLGTLMSTRNIANKGGTNKTLSSSSPSGGNDGDIWYQL